MRPRTIHLFADTNLFIQCRPLDELDWALVAGEASEIYVVVSKPVQMVHYLPLTAIEIEDLVAMLVERYPVLTVNTKSDGVLERMGTHMTETFIPPTAEEVAQYQQVEYPAWIERCRAYLAKFHQRAQRDETPPAIVFGARNAGSRPAKDVLVSMHANTFGIRATRGATRRAPYGWSRRFPRPPVAPSGSWLLVCHIEAENLSNAVELKVPVRLTVRRESCLSIARALIADPTTSK
jgi:hypothetical protein